MTKLKAPLREQLTARVDESTVQRIWSGVRAKRGGSLFVTRRSLPALRYAVVVLTALAVALLLTAGLRYRTGHAPPLVASGPLVTRAGATLSTLGGEHASEDELSDGSSIRLAPGSRLEVLENTSKTFVSVLRSGRGAFQVQPGGPRRWTIEAGLATVEVVGTRFSVARHEGSVEVAVEHGVVLVRSELIADRVQRLSAGQRLSIALPSAAAPTFAVPAGSAVGVPQPAPSTASVAPLPAGSGATAPATSLEGLLDLANEQRRRGDLNGAEASLRRALNEHPRSPRAAIVAFTLGKLLLDAEGRPAEAAAAFEHCLSASPPSALAEDALYRAAEAHARAGQMAAASANARSYQSRYPSGRYARDVSRWIGEP